MAFNVHNPGWRPSRWLRRLHVGLVASMFIAGIALAAACTPEYSGAVRFIQQDNVAGGGVSLSVDHYRNSDYSCGLGGNYTFSVFNPSGNPGGYAPLWVYLHGGGVGYFDEGGNYQTSFGADASTWNYEESAASLIGELAGVTLDASGNLKDTAVVRRIAQGYRVLVVSMCDHDLYSGQGQPYPNNPAGGTVDGLLATTAAIDYTTSFYATSHVFVHGVSAGSVGAFSLAQSYAAQGRPLTGVIADSYVSSWRIYTIFDSFAGAGGFPFGSSFNVREAVAKVGPMVDPAQGFDPESAIAGGFSATPVLFIGGDADPFCAGNQWQVGEAARSGLNNCDWIYDGVRQAVARQSNSPHHVVILDGAGHVPTIEPGPATDVVDSFVFDVMSSSPALFSR